MNDLKRFVAVAGATIIAATGLVACGSDDGQETDAALTTSDAPTGASWSTSDTRGLAVPDGDAGPRETDPVPHGWEHSPQGAVLAAMNAQAYMATAGEDTWSDVSRLMLAPGPGRDQWAQARSLMKIDGELKDAPAFVGFRFSEYDDDHAVVLLAADYPKNGVMAMPVQLTWLDDDWKVVMPTQGEEPDLAKVKNESDFVSFKMGEKNNG